MTSTATPTTITTLTGEVLHECGDSWVTAQEHAEYSAAEAAALESETRPC